MDFDKPIYAEIEGDDDSKKLREYFVEHRITFKETTEDYKFIGDIHVFECNILDKETLQAANRDTDALFYQ